MAGRTLASLRFSRRRLAGFSLTTGAGLLLGSQMSRVGAQTQLTATMVAHGAGFGDPGYDALADAGGQKAQAELGVAWNVIEAPDATGVVATLQAGAADGDLTVGVGTALAAAMAEVAGHFPSRNFLLIDGAVEAPNVASVVFKAQEAAFLAGVVAAWSTKNARIGILGGNQAAIEAVETGFRAGVTTENSFLTIDAVYADSSDDPAKGKELAKGLIDAGADLIFAAAGATGVGAYQAAQEHGAGVWVIGTDIDRESAAPGVQLCVAQKGIDTAVFRALQQLVDGQFVAGTQRLGLAEDGVSLVTPGDRVQAPILARSENYESRLLAGEFSVPSTAAELASWTPPGQPAGPEPCDCVE